MHGLIGDDVVGSSRLDWWWGSLGDVGMRCGAGIGRGLVGWLVGWWREERGILCGDSFASCGSDLDGASLGIICF